MAPRPELQLFILMFICMFLCICGTSGFPSADGSATRTIPPTPPRPPHLPRLTDGPGRDEIPAHLDLSGWGLGGWCFRRRERQNTRRWHLSLIMHNDCRSAIALIHLQAAARSLARSAICSAATRLNVGSLCRCLPRFTRAGVSTPRKALTVPREEQERERERPPACTLMEPPPLHNLPSQ